MKLITLVFGVVVIAVAGVAAAQAPAQKPKFEIVNIKRSTATEGNARIGDQPEGRFIASYITLRRLIQFAYHENEQFIGGPDWLDNEHWDIEAKKPNTAVPGTLVYMVQSLLEDRFQLMAHQEARQLPLYELSVATGGFKLRPLSTDSCVVRDIPNVVAGWRSNNAGRVRFAQVVQPGEKRTCSLTAVRAVDDRTWIFSAQAATITEFAQLLRIGLRRQDGPIVNKTGMSGIYNFRVEIAVDDPARGISPTENPTVPSISATLQEQLGLKLESSKGPVEVLVIDSVSRPTEN
jgi:uncharacterized protein (TIGR03435 family)